MKVGVLFALSLLLVFSLQVGAIGLSDSASDSGSLVCPGINDGGAVSSGSVAAGVSGSASSLGAYTISNSYASATGPVTNETIIPFFGGAPRIYDTTAGVRRSSYEAGTSFQKAFALGVKTTKTPANQTGNYCDNYNRASTGPASRWKTYNLLVDAEGQAAVIGSGTKTEVRSSSDSGVLSFPYCITEGSFTSLSNFAICYNYGVSIQVTNASFGSNPFSFAYSGASGIGSSYGEKEWKGTDNTTQVPIYPVAVLKSKATGDIIFRGASTCGKTAFYRDYGSGGSTTGSSSESWSRNSNTGSYRPFANGCHLLGNSQANPCSISNGRGTISGPYEEMPSIIGKRNVQGMQCPTDLMDNGTCNPGTGQAFKPTEQNLQDMQDWITAAGGPANVRVDTYEAVQGSPPAFSWPGADNGTIFGDLQWWASGVYVNYQPANCSGTPTGTVPPFYCEVTASFPSQSSNPKRVQWNVTPFNYTVSPQSLVYKWEGSNDFTGNAKLVQWDYTTTGPQYGRVSVTGPGGLRAICNNTTTIGAPLSVDCTAVPQTAYPSDDVLWTAYPKHGSGAYTNYEWSGDLGNGSPDPASSSFTAKYDSTGRKNVSVKVTDSLGNTATASCSTNIIPITGINLTCAPDKPNAKKGEPVVWTATSSDPTLTYQWSGDLGTVTPNATTNPVTSTYTTFGEKKVSVTASSGGTSATADCKTLVGPTCEINTPPQPTPKDADVASTLKFANFAQPITKTTIACGDKAKLKTQPTCTGTEGNCPFTCEKYQTNGTISATIENTNGESVTCTAPIVVATLPPVCDLSPNPLSVVRASDAVFSLGLSNFLTPPKKTDITVTCIDGTETKAGIADCTEGTDSCAVICQDYENGGGTVTAKVVSGNQTATCSAEVILLGPSRSCKVIPPSQTVTSPGSASFAIGLVNFTVAPNKDSVAVTCNGATQTAGKVSSCTSSSCAAKCGTYQNSGTNSVTYLLEVAIQNTNPLVECRGSITVNPLTGCPGCGSPSPSPSPSPGLSDPNLVSILIDTVPSTKRIYQIKQSPAEQVEVAITVSRRANSGVNSVEFNLNRGFMSSSAEVVRLPSSGKVLFGAKDSVTLTKANFPQFIEPADSLETGIHIYITQILNIYNSSGSTMVDPVLQDNAASVSVAIQIPRKAAVPEIPFAFAAFIALAVFFIIVKNRKQN